MTKSQHKGYACALGAVIIWTGFILVSRRGGISLLSAYDVIAIRYITSGLLLLPVWFLWKRFNILEFRFVVTGLIGGMAYAIFTFKGFECAPASHAAVLLPGLLPFTIIFLTSLLNKERHSLIK